MTMSRSFERFYPWIFGFAAGALAYLVGLILPSEEGRLTALLSASISTSAILVGFLATTKQPPAEAGGFGLRTGSPDTRRLNDASFYGSVLKSSFGFGSKWCSK